MFCSYTAKSHIAVESGDSKIEGTNISSEKDPSRDGRVFPLIIGRKLELLKTAMEPVKITGNYLEWLVLKLNRSEPPR